MLKTGDLIELMQRYFYGTVYRGGNMYYAHLQTTIGKITLIGDEEGLQELFVHTDATNRTLVIPADWEENPLFFKEIEASLACYFKGTLKHFNVRLNPMGTPFQKQVWEALREIPYGETRSYGEIAEQIGRQKACRAVGAANGKNPIPIIIPCHRVIGKNGKLTGFALGIEIKETLLRLENREGRE